MAQMFTVGEGLLSNEDFLSKVVELIQSDWIIYNNKKIGYYNIPAAFDIEVTSFYDGPEESENKRGVMYHWQFGIWNYITTGRTWAQFKTLMKAIKVVMGLNDDLRMCVYVHNLPYEFQFMRKHLEWEEVFLLDERKPVYANAHGIEFRCSLKLSGGKSLDAVSRDLQKYICRKMVGDLDYNLLRSPLTPLTEAELKYCENDVRVLLCYIMEKIEQDGNITKIPLTNTGYVRNYCRKQCFKRWKRYRTMIDNLRISPEDYQQLRRGFQGGFVHANAHYANKVLTNVGSHDFTSSYPSVMLLEKFPMSNPHYLSGEVSEVQLTKLLLTKCCIFEFEAWNIVPKRHQEHPISKSKCYICENYVTDNGRIVMAEHIKTTITEQDYFVYSEFYDWERISISEFRYFDKNYLPKDFVLSILDLYEKKSTLKHNPEEALNYMISKNMLNAAYGMIVTDPVRDVLEYHDNTYFTHPANLAEAIERYNSNIRRFLYYPWGLWVTAYARANLFSGILELGDDYVYSDTDSVKSINTSAHLDYFKRYDDNIREKIAESADYFKISTERYSPLGLTIGVWDDEGEYDRFKTLGAKRYLTEKDGKFVLTVAGTNKKKSMNYLVSTGMPFTEFSDGLVIPRDKSGRNILSYIDYPTAGSIVDYNGVPYSYKELSSVHMEASEYHLSQSQAFIDYLKGLKETNE